MIQKFVKLISLKIRFVARNLINYFHKRYLSRKKRRGGKNARKGKYIIDATQFFHITQR